MTHRHRGPVKLCRGHAVDRLAEVVDLHESGIEPAPNTGNDYASRFMRGVYHHNDNLLVLVDFTKLSSLSHSISCAGLTIL